MKSGKEHSFGRRWALRLSSWLIMLIITFVLSEIVVFISVKYGGLNIILPTYDSSGPEDLLPERSFIYGHRHQPNSTYKVRKNCLNTEYHFNALGFRDQLAPKKSSGPRVLVLGDSFMEGIGVEEEERLSDLLEAESGIPHLNFGMADKGSTQIAVIYDSIASQYQHDAILISLFPTNDLIDDDPRYGKTTDKIRPCWVGEYPNYQLRFVPDSAPAKKKTVAWKHFLKTHTYTYDALFYLKESIKSSLNSGEYYPPVGYFNYEEAQINRLQYSLAHIRQKAGNRPISLLCIPSHLDLSPSTTALANSIEQPIQSICEDLNIEFIGLLPHFMQLEENKRQDLYFSCDSHWNQEGHQAVKEILLKESSIYQKATDESQNL